MEQRPHILYQHAVERNIRPRGKKNWSSPRRPTRQLRSKWRPPRQKKKPDSPSEPDRMHTNVFKALYETQRQSMLRFALQSWPGFARRPPKRGKRKPDSRNANSYHEVATREQAQSALKCQRRYGMQKFPRQVPSLLRAVLSPSPVFSLPRGLPFCPKRI